MDFGKLLNVDSVNFRLQAEPAGNAEVLASTQSPGPRALYIGPTGYHMKPWVGKWYPPGAREQDFLRHYAKQFNTIEFNTTYYRMPDPSTVRRWRSEVPDDFRFCPKIPQSISQANDLGLNGTAPQIFFEALENFGETLGCSFLQLPPYFSPRELPILARFLENYAQLSPLSVEVRHPGFFQKTAAAEDYFQLLQQHQVSAVITDVAGRRDVCHLRLTNSRTLIRFVGNGLHPSDHTRVEDWAERLSLWFEQGLKEAYFFCHEPDNLLAPELSAICAEIFTQTIPGLTVRGPKLVDGQQGLLF